LQGRPCSFKAEDNSATPAGGSQGFATGGKINNILNIQHIVKNHFNAFIIFTQNPHVKFEPYLENINKKSNINKKKISKNSDSDKKLKTSLLRKNEFALILFGAFLLTILIFFFFFRSSNSKSEVFEQNVSSASFSDFEMRIQNIEKALQIGHSLKSEGVNFKESVTQVNHIKDRLGRLETAFSVKFDSLIDRIGKIEKSISQLENKTVKKESEPKAAVPVKKAVKKKSQFHMVKKEETLYSISKQYNISIDKLRELNKLSKGATIYPGDNLLVR